jgi:hypothetical protein
VLGSSYSLHFFPFALLKLLPLPLCAGALASACLVSELSGDLRAVEKAVDSDLIR